MVEALQTKSLLLLPFDTLISCFPARFIKTMQCTFSLKTHSISLPYFRKTYIIVVSSGFGREFAVKANYLTKFVQIKILKHDCLTI